MSARIISLGSVNVDIQLRADRWPEAGETLLGQDFLMAGGGKAANVAWLARNLGIEAQLIARIGSDSLQEIALHPLRTLGVDLSTIRSIKNESTGVSVIMVQPNGRKGIIMAPNANAVWSEEDEEFVKNAIHTAPTGSVLSVDLEVPLPIVKQAVRQAEECGMVIVLDPSPSERLDEELLKSGCYLTPNQSEAQRLTKIPIENHDHALEAASRIRQHGNKGVCVKLGTGGCAIATADDQFVISAPEVHAVDTTGAGDAFAGAFSVAMLEHQPPEQAAVYAVAASTHAVTGYGSQSSYPTRRQIESLLQRVVLKKI
ncbi:ribokinase [Candidatus Nitrospira allomarina]|uniref:Ribokinase n=1 Tax=Candidatus Nitrospira allomarina TaxID=3020900 RepID=A0AA96GAK3_9BACT|nr:ribokinase [Candidatus Nitrospira allomarina]WNM56635.1 ribokinase [Candidatus Nitrospira allomarina]